jgi:putative DNA methylase
MRPFPKRLIEVDLPIKRISAHARREKSIRHGHISTLHIWWARRPLAACRAVLCAALWPDPADEHCPQSFRETAARLMHKFAFTAAEERSVADLCHPYTWGKLSVLRQPDGQLDPTNSDHLNFLRYLLLDFIADFSNWDASTEPHYLEMARALTQAAHEGLGGLPGTRPLVVDPFAGGGAIPLEALRIGADAFASDLNPVAVLLNKVVLEYIPKYGQRLADEVRKWGEWVKEQAEKELAEFYPKDPDGATPIAYLWARTIRCEGPNCGAEVPLMRGLWLAKRKSGSVALRMVPNLTKKRVEFEIKVNAEARDVGEGTVRRGSATCPVCGYTTPATSVRQQLGGRQGGTADARLLVVVTTRPGQHGRFYRLPGKYDMEAVRRAAAELEHRETAHTGFLNLVPDEPTPEGGGSGAGRAFSQRNYGMDAFEDLFTPRQLLALTTLARLVREVGNGYATQQDTQFATAVQTALALALDRQSDYGSSLCRWVPGGEFIGNTFGRQALSMIWDFVEVYPFSGATGDWNGAIEWVAKVCEAGGRGKLPSGKVERASATDYPLPDDMAQCFFTDPPYYDAVPYADLSDFFYVWLKRTLGDQQPHIFSENLTPKEAECIVDEVKGKDKTYFERTMTQAMAEGRRVVAPSGVGLVVFAHKTTSGWEALMQAMVDAGWVMTGSWPIDTERPGRLRAHKSAALASSIHLVCRPRENPDGSLRIDAVGDWRDILAELPKRIHEWMPRLTQESVVGADAIFACLGPALEVFSRYSRVERASGEQVTLREYLEHVWAAISKAALDMIFEGADATGFEADARLTAMWLWTLSTAPDDVEASANDKVIKSAGYALEYDAARKIAQGLGAHLEQLGTMVEIRGNKARLLPVAERTRALFGKEGPSASRQGRSETQLSFFDEVGGTKEKDSVEELGAAAHGATVLDRVHQAMLLFAAGRSEALRRFLVEEGAGREARFWRLAQALSALYPPQTDEKRWVDGVLARKKGLGF